MKWVPLHLIKLLKQGDELAARVEARTPDGIAWVWVRPYKESSVLGAWDRERLPPGTLENEHWRFLVRVFEAPRKLLDGWHDLSDEELLRDEKYQVDTLDEVDELLGRLVGDPSKLEAQPFDSADGRFPF